MKTSKSEVHQPGKPVRTRRRGISGKSVATIRQVNFRCTAPPGCAVYLAGSFNQWNPQRHPMVEDADPGVYHAALMLPMGRHEYKFVVNGEWCLDAKCPECVANAYGTRNSVLTV